MKKKIDADLGPVDIVVNNAGLLFAPPLIDDTPEGNETIKKMVDVNVLAMLWVSLLNSLVDFFFAEKITSFFVLVVLFLAGY